MRKNLLMVHLESISRANLWQFRNELGTVWRLMAQSIQFTRFYTASCSTIMTINDVMLGNGNAHDWHTRFSEYIQGPRAFFKLYPLTEMLIKAGWKHSIFSSSPFQKIERSIDANGILIENTPNIPSLVDSLLTECKECRDNEQPFFSYFWDDTSHLAFQCEPKNKAKSIQERMSLGYRLIDASLNRILQGLIELGLWENTVIVCFGDHGDEPWGHGLNRGYSHSIAPYSGICWTPMFIFDHEKEAAISSRMASTLGLNMTLVKYMLKNVELTAEQESELFPPEYGYGMQGDIFDSGKQSSSLLSQNMFALQKERDDPEKGMVKGYGLTDGNYRLVVSSGGGDPEQGGMELFFEQMDPTNSRNLLDFFLLDENGDIKEFNPPPDAVGKHFLFAFRPPQVKSIMEAFAALKRELIRRVRMKEGLGLVFNVTGEWELFPSNAFTHTKKRL